MDVKRTLRIFIVVGLAGLLILGLAACTRSAYKSPTGGTATASFKIPSGPTPTEEALPFIEAATATAVVVVVPEEGGGQQPAAATPVPATAAPQQALEERPVVKPTEGKPPQTYTLQKGEFPFCIARRFNVNQSELLALNGMTLNSKPLVGTVLKIPQTGHPFVTNRALKSHPTDYTVKSGDTIYTIACTFGDVSPDMIGLANDIKAPYNVSAGQVLHIP